jgi:SAM-dependent methyltransferase
MNPEQIKQRVREVYGAAIRTPTSCCGKPGDAALTNPAAPGARTSFGCGDPLAMVDVLAGQNVLDVGSGPGLDALAAARRVGPHGAVIGVDMTEAMILKARENAEAAGAGNVEFRAGDAESLPAGDGWADWVISNCVVNLVPDKEAAFREIHRVLKPGGRFSITDLVGENLPPGILADPGKYCACIGGAPSEKEYLDAARKAGFEQVEVKDRFAWEAPELEGTNGKVWSIKVTARKPC